MARHRLLLLRAIAWRSSTQQAIARLNLRVTAPCRRRRRRRSEVALEAQAEDGPGGPGPYRLRLRLPRPVDADRVRAKWKKAGRCLHVGLPLAEP
jgi:hypothetical protein